MKERASLCVREPLPLILVLFGVHVFVVPIPDFLLNCVVDDRAGRIARVFAGDYIEAHREGCRYVEEHFGARIDERLELIQNVSVIWPIIPVCR